MRDSIYKATTPKRWNEYLKFLEWCPKIDVVVDLMNVRMWDQYRNKVWVSIKSARTHVAHNACSLELLETFWRRFGIDTYLAHLLGFRLLSR